jgi:hypothetical protein
LLLLFFSERLYEIGFFTDLISKNPIRNASIGSQFARHIKPKERPTHQSIFKEKSKTQSGKRIYIEDFQYNMNDC